MGWWSFSGAVLVLGCNRGFPAGKGAGNQELPVFKPIRRSHPRFAAALAGEAGGTGRLIPCQNTLIASAR